ncbi:VanZ like protein [Promicromonospora sp. AC04]|uniref:VanZ family protein n=1 Tax=Promicromonospora sp. AC04 TaxID=2135723 RepID=UPI000D384AD4|nr:VanZ family protein [Promicromonospora sp. AC04]PUB19792.1 VanZ like protein [Promicromonospora sp. AC04]
MISTFLVAHHDLVPVAFLLIALVCLGVGYLALRHPRSGRILWALLALAALPVIVLALVPTSISRPDDVVCTVQFSVPTLGGVETLANIALFFPLTFFAALATRRPLLMFVAGSGLSAAIEALQAVAPAIGRACDTNDWMMNTIGAAVGALLAWGTMTVAKGARAAVRP